MPWLRNGDDGTGHPMVLALAGTKGADERTVDEAWGYLQRLAMHSAGHLTDGAITLTVATFVAWGNRSRASRLLGQLAEVGLVVVEGRGRARLWRITDEVPELLHIRTRADVEWERQRRADNANPDLTMPVRRRDGDACRWCGVVVIWKDRRGNRAGTYDHLEPGKPATVETYVVACKKCNSSRKADPDGSWGAANPLRPVPVRPHYTPGTVTQLLEYGYSPGELGVTLTDSSAGTASPTPAGVGGTRSAGAPRVATSTSTDVGITHATECDLDVDGRRDTAPNRRENASNSTRKTPTECIDTTVLPGHDPPDLQIPADREGTARDGTGRDGTGAAPPPSGAAVGVPDRGGGRSRRGRRRGGSGSGEEGVR